MANIRYDEEVKDQTIQNSFRIAFPILFPVYFVCHFYDWTMARDQAWLFLGIRLTLLPLIALFYFAFKNKWQGAWYLWFVWTSAAAVSAQMTVMAALASHPDIYLLAVLMMGCAFLMLFPLPGKHNIITGLCIFVPYCGYLIAESLDSHYRFSLGVQTLGMTAVFVAASSSIDRARLRSFRQKTDLFVLATTDSLSGLKLRRYFFNRFIQELSLQFRKREDLFLSAVMIDIDSFKTINDRYGHQAGDRCIRHIGDIIQKGIRIYDVPCRFGGEEFVVLFPAAQLSETAMVCERLRKSIENSTVMIGTREVRLTVSIGVSGVMPPIPKEVQNMHFQSAKDQQIFLVKSMMRVIKEADQALYEAKSKGKNQVVIGKPANLLGEVSQEELPILKQYLVYFEHQSLIFDDHEAAEDKAEEDFIFYPPEFFSRRCVEGLYRRYRDPEWSETLAMIHLENVDFKLAKKHLGNLFRLADVISVMDTSLIGVLFVGMNSESLSIIRERIARKLSAIPGMEKIEVRISAAELKFQDENWTQETSKLVNNEDFAKEVERIFSILKRHRFGAREMLYFHQIPVLSDKRANA